MVGPVNSPLAVLFPGPLAPLGQALVLADDPRPALSWDEYLEPERLQANLLRFLPEHGEGDPRARVSLWAKYHFLRLVPAVVAASLSSDWRLPVRASEVAVILGDDGLPAAFRLADAGKPWAHAPRHGFERFEELFDGHIDPLIRALCAQVKLAPKVLWSSVGHYYEWIVGELASQHLPVQRVAQAREWLEQSCRPDGFRNPLHDSIRYVARPGLEGVHRQRRHCCIRYRLPGKALCGNCPHIDKPPAGYDVSLASVP
ncbi:siderophore-iron reductase FhuF [Halopseudomonas phragmitis]|uniref:Siderophore-iron reductase FhuF n=1 Tax=Halopseudomonas phragmitis TaxID=1931241 RepID=A0A1V0B1X1_9GAMM|nr:siderophore-iron reductase FhuF [Halopseudomonas phragmitis]